MVRKELEKRVERLSKLAEGADPEAQAVLQAAEADPEYAALAEQCRGVLDYAYVKVRDGRGLTEEEERAVDALWDGFWDSALRIAAERGVSPERLFRASGRPTQF